MTKKINTLIEHLPLIMIVVLLDQATKSFFIYHVKEQIGMSIKITDFFSIVYAWNHGISFGIFSNYYQYSNYIFIAVNISITAYLVYLLTESRSLIERLGIAIILGGSVGNIIDRIFRGAVFDFLYFHYNDLGFPVFNLADCFINIGVFLIIVHCLFNIKKSKL